MVCTEKNCDATVLKRICHVRESAHWQNKMIMLHSFLIPLLIFWWVFQHMEVPLSCLLRNQSCLFISWTVIINTCFYMELVLHVIKWSSYSEQLESGFMSNDKKKDGEKLTFQLRYLAVWQKTDTAQMERSYPCWAKLHFQQSFPVYRQKYW